MLFLQDYDRLAEMIRKHSKGSEAFGRLIQWWDENGNPIADYLGMTRADGDVYVLLSVLERLHEKAIQARQVTRRQ